MENERLISAPELVIKLVKKYHNDNGMVCYDAVMATIADAPTVDAVEVVHGRWIFKHNPITDPKKYFIRIVCSKCNLHTGQTSNYCPNCGAKMDGGNEDG